MRAVICKELGPLENLSFEEVPTVPLLSGHIRLRVLASGVNYVDGLLIQGKYQIKPPTPFIPGMEVVGEVIECFEDVAQTLLGQRVLANIGFGGFATEAVVRADRAIAIPDTLTTGQAASFLQSYLTGWFALTRRAHISVESTAGKDQWMLVLGAGGGVGLAAVDIGVSLGLKVIAAASSQEKRELAVARGASAVIDSGSEDVKERAKEISGGGVDILYDPVGGTLGETCLRALGEDGQYLVIGFVGGIPQLPANQILLRNRRIIGVDWGAWAGRNPQGNAELLQEVLKKIADKELCPVEPQVYLLSEAATALIDLEERRVAGKVVLVADDAK
ncbi:MAG: NADPH:quinone oxidoreductase family protein [Actinomycetes bacterium]